MCQATLKLRARRRPVGAVASHNVPARVFNGLPSRRLAERASPRKASSNSAYCVEVCLGIGSIQLVSKPAIQAMF
jgi:hypothetical protein